MSLGPKENTAIESMNQWGGGGDNNGKEYISNIVSEYGQDIPQPQT